MPALQKSSLGYLSRQSRCRRNPKPRWQSNSAALPRNRPERPCRNNASPCLPGRREWVRPCRPRLSKSGHEPARRKKHGHYGKDDPRANCQLLSSNCPHVRLYSTTRIHGIVVEHVATTDVHGFAAAPRIAPAPPCGTVPLIPTFSGKEDVHGLDHSWAFWLSSPLLLIGMYNSLVQLRVRCDSAWSDIDVQLKRRHDLIPNLVETVKGYATHEKGTFENIAKFRSQAMQATTPGGQGRGGEPADRRPEEPVCGGGKLS